MEKINRWNRFGRQGLWIDYGKFGIICKRNYLNGQYHGERIWFCDNGKIKEKNYWFKGEIVNYDSYFFDLGVVKEDSFHHQLF
jgi:hypothetical protein